MQGGGWWRLNNTVEENEVLTVEEAARLLRVSPWTVRDLARRGKLPGRRVGKEWRFWRRALLEWLRGETPPSGTAGGETET